MYKNPLFHNPIDFDWVLIKRSFLFPKESFDIENSEPNRMKGWRKQLDALNIKC